MPRNRRQFNLPKCYCGRVAVLKTSWTDKNPSRRFAACAHSLGESCDFFERLDPEMCERSLEVILGLLRRIRRTEVEIELGAENMKKCEEKADEVKVKNKRLLAENKRLRLKIRWLVIAVGILFLLYISSSHSTVVKNEDDKVMLKHKAIGTV